MKSDMSYFESEHGKPYDLRPKNCLRYYDIYQPCWKTNIVYNATNSFNKLPTRIQFENSTKRFKRFRAHILFQENSYSVLEFLED